MEFNAGIVLSSSSGNNWIVSGKAHHTPPGSTPSPNGDLNSVVSNRRRMRRSKSQQRAEEGQHLVKPRGDKPLRDTRLQWPGNIMLAVNN